MYNDSVVLAYKEGTPEFDSVYRDDVSSYEFGITLEEESTSGFFKPDTKQIRVNFIVSSFIQREIRGLRTEIESITNNLDGEERYRGKETERAKSLRAKLTRYIIELKNIIRNMFFGQYKRAIKTISHEMIHARQFYGPESLVQGKEKPNTLLEEYKIFERFYNQINGPLELKKHIFSVLQQTIRHMCISIEIEAYARGMLTYCQRNKIGFERHIIETNREYSRSFYNITKETVDKFPRQEAVEQIRELVTKMIEALFKYRQDRIIQYKDKVLDPQHRFNYYYQQKQDKLDRKQGIK